MKGPSNDHFSLRLSESGHFKGPSDAHSCQTMFESDVILAEWIDLCSNASLSHSSRWSTKRKPELQSNLTTRLKAILAGFRVLVQANDMGEVEEQEDREIAKRTTSPRRKRQEKPQRNEFEKILGR